MTRADPFEAIECDADIARQRLRQRMDREERKSIALRRFANARRAGKSIGGEEQVDNGSVGTTMHGANEAPIVLFHDQARFLEQFA